MPYEQFDRFAVKMEPLSSRTNKKFIETDHVAPVWNGEFAAASQANTTSQNRL